MTSQTLQSKMIKSNAFGRLNVVIGLTTLTAVALILGCVNQQTTKQDGLYVNRSLVKANATVEDFCKAQGNITELVRNNKVVLSR